MCSITLAILPNGEGKFIVPIQRYIIFFKWIERIKIVMKTYLKSNEEEKNILTAHSV